VESVMMDLFVYTLDSVILANKKNKKFMMR